MPAVFCGVLSAGHVTDVGPALHQLQAFRIGEKRSDHCEPVLHFSGRRLTLGNHERSLRVGSQARSGPLHHQLWRRRADAQARRISEPTGEVMQLRWTRSPKRASATAAPPKKLTSR